MSKEIESIFKKLTANKRYRSDDFTDEFYHIFNEEHQCFSNFSKKRVGNTS